MKCNQIQELLLTDYLDNCLEKSLKTKIDEHIGQCPECMQFKKAAVLATVDVFKGLEKERVPENLWSKIESSLENEPQIAQGAGLWSTFFRPLFANPAPVLTIAVLIIFLGLGRVNQWNAHRVQLNQQSKEFLVSVMNSSSAILIDDDEGYGTNVEQVFL
ncbi:MAG: zf-HC2 domain-containing protein [Candidatus Omnitrophica bacterium]|nr:zf-HC2 domain-containing protein [Candidatus Omnitrophota bacterium]